MVEVPLKPPRHLVHAPQQRRGHERQEALIRAGLHLTEDRDWDAVKVGDIAAEIGCSIGTFYTRFRTKETYFDVLLDLMVQTMVQRTEAFHTAPERSGEAPAEFIASWVHLGVQSFRAHRGLYATALLNLRRLAPEARVGSPLVLLRDRSRDSLLQAMARYPDWQSAAARSRLLFAHQMMQGVLLNAVLTNPGPLQLDDPAFETELTAALRAYLGIA